MLAGFQLKCSCLVVVVVNTRTWGDKLPLLIGFCHIHLSPMGGMFVHFALYIEGYAAVSLPALSNCVALYTCLRGKQWMKVIIHLGKMNTLRRLKVPKDTAAPSRNFKCIWMPSCHSLFPAPFAVRKSMKQVAPDLSSLEVMKTKLSE